MDVREKLVELLRGAVHINSENVEKWILGGKQGEIPNIFNTQADHLIDHGVTVREQNGCEHCRTASYTENPFTVITQMGREVKTQFNFCPNCGRRLPQPPKGE